MIFYNFIEFFSFFVEILSTGIAQQKCVVLNVDYSALDWAIVMSTDQIALLTNEKTLFKVKNINTIAV